MAKLSSKPTSGNLSDLSQVSVPVSYSTTTGLALLLSDMIVSSDKTVPYARAVSTSEFTSGVYPFPKPDGYTAVPYQLPMLEPRNLYVGEDAIAACQPVKLYQIGNKAYTADGVAVNADYMTAAFPVKINPTAFTSGSDTVQPFEQNQSVVVRIYKNAGVGITWAGGNVVNNGLPDAAISAATELVFVVTNVLGTYQITEWIAPDFVTANIGTLKTTAKSNFAAIVNELFDKAPNGTAGGDLTGSYPNPTIGNGKVTAAKLAPGVIPASLPPSGTAGGDLSGSYPNPTIGNGKVTAAKLAAGVIPTSLPPSGTAGGDLGGSYPNPTVKYTSAPFTITDFAAPPQSLLALGNGSTCNIVANNAMSGPYSGFTGVGTATRVTGDMIGLVYKMSDPDRANGISGYWIGELLTESEVVGWRDTLENGSHKNLIFEDIVIRQGDPATSFKLNVGGVLNLQRFMIIGKLYGIANSPVSVNIITYLHWVGLEQHIVAFPLSMSGTLVNCCFVRAYIPDLSINKVNLQMLGAPANATFTITTIQRM